MNELIKQAAEDCHLRHGIGKTGGYYSIIVNHFLSFAKGNVRTDGILFADEVVEDMIARERERMGKFAEWAGGECWEYVGGTAQSWLRWDDDNVYGAVESKTTSELIEIFNTQNKER